MNTLGVYYWSKSIPTAGFNIWVVGNTSALSTAVEAIEVMAAVGGHSQHQRSRPVVGDNGLSKELEWVCTQMHH